MTSFSQNGVAKITVEGRDFVFIRPTIAYLRRYSAIEKYFLSLSAEKFETIFADDKTFKEFSRMWRRLCRVAFAKNWLLSLLWLVRLPRELRLSVLSYPDFEEVAKSFFVFVGDRTTRPGASSPDTSSSAKTDDTSPRLQEKTS